MPSGSSSRTRSKAPKTDDFNAQRLKEINKAVDTITKRLVPGKADYSSASAWANVMGMLLTAGTTVSRAVACAPSTNFAFVYQYGNDDDDGGDDIGLIAPTIRGQYVEMDGPALHQGEH